MLLAWPDKTVTVLLYLIAIWAIIGGLVQVAVAVSLRKVPGSGWGWGVFAGLLSVAFGILIFTQTGAALTVIIGIIGIWALIFGVLMTAFGFQIRSLGKKAGQVGR
ncbi:DUF308 domain-containing protein [Oerskovia sp. M15]